MAMVIMDIMARDLLMLSQLLLLSLVMDMVMDMAMDILAMDMVTTVKQKPECCYFLEFSTPEVDHNRSSQHK